jgi:preprotein translocase subunit SecF
MRTTLSLDDDVAVLLEQVRKRRKGRLKEIVNQALREGLTRMTRVRKRVTQYRTPETSLGRCLVGSLDDVAEVLAVAEGERFP